MLLAICLLQGKGFTIALFRLQGRIKMSSKGMDELLKKQTK
jgi:hypothetical protein